MQLPTDNSTVHRELCVEITLYDKLIGRYSAVHLTDQFSGSNGAISLQRVYIPEKW